MSLLLTSENVFEYLDGLGLWAVGQPAEHLEPKAGKNFNLRVGGGDHDLLIKQAPFEPDGSLSGGLTQESWFYQLLLDVPGLELLRSRILQPLHFDPENSILVFPFLEGVCDLSDFYHQFILTEDCRQTPLPPSIAAALGTFFATLHGSTFQSSAVKHLWMTHYYGDPDLDERLVPDFLKGLRRITPEDFCQIPTDALKFFRFYQRYPEIGEAISDLNQSFVPCCAVHDDPRLANFLLLDPLQSEFGQSNPSNQPARVQAIDWEMWRWGDPAYDLGQLLANYLKMWLGSLPMSAQLDLSKALNMAAVPLLAVQASTQACIRNYFLSFPKILQVQPDFLVRTTQFIGLGLVRQVQLDISQKNSIGNIEMALVQVAKSLLCQPEAAIPTVFGQDRETLENAALSTSDSVVSQIREVA